MQTPVTRQVELVREFERSGLSGPRFAELAGVRYQTFATWRRRHGAQSPAREQCRPVFLEVTAAQTATAASTLEIALAGGAQVSLRDAGQVPLLATLLKALS